MALKNISALKDEINHLEEAESLLHEIYFGLGPYGIRTVLQEHCKEFFLTDVDKLLTKLDRHFNFDDSE